MTDTGADEAYNASEGILDGSLDYAWTPDAETGPMSRKARSAAAQKDYAALAIMHLAMRDICPCPSCYLVREYDRTHP